MFVPGAASAQQFTERIRGGLQTAGEPAGLSGGAKLETMIGGIINIALGTVGVILLALLIYAGFLWMTAGGDTDKVKTARGIIFNAIIGLLITVLAFAISEFVIERLIEIQAGGSPT
jgi:hypothetical protein